VKVGLQRAERVAQEEIVLLATGGFRRRRLRTSVIWRRVVVPKQRCGSGTHHSVAKSASYPSDVRSGLRWEARTGRAARQED